MRRRRNSTSGLKYASTAAALFARNRCYLVNDKTLLDEIDGFADAPPDFRARAGAVLANVGHTPSELAVAVEAITALNREMWSVSSPPASSPRSPSGSR